MLVENKSAGFTDARRAWKNFRARSGRLFRRYHIGGLQQLRLPAGGNFCWKSARAIGQSERHRSVGAHPLQPRAGRKDFDFSQGTCRAYGKREQIGEAWWTCARARNLRQSISPARSCCSQPVDATAHGQRFQRRAGRGELIMRARTAWTQQRISWGTGCRMCAACAVGLTPWAQEVDLAMRRYKLGLKTRPSGVFLPACRRRRVAEISNRFAVVAHGQSVSAFDRILTIPYLTQCRLCIS